VSNLGRVRDEVFAGVVIKFGRSIRVVGTPVILISRLTVSSSASGLPWLIEGLEVEHIEVPVKSGTDTLLPEVVGFFGTRSRGSVVGSPYRSGQYTFTEID